MLMNVHHKLFWTGDFPDRTKVQLGIILPRDNRNVFAIGHQLSVNFNFVSSSLAFRNCIGEGFLVPWSLSVPSFLVPGLGSYMYIEASGRSEGDKARLISPTLLGPQCMTFFYNMFGFTMGSLVIYIRDTSGGNESITWVQSGNKGLAWKEEHLSINEEDEYQASWVQRCVLTSLPLFGVAMELVHRLEFPTHSPIHTLLQRTTNPPTLPSGQPASKCCAQCC